MSYTSRPTLFSAAIELLPHLSSKPLAQCSDEEINALAKRGIQIAKLIADELSENFWSPTVAPLPTPASLDHMTAHHREGTGQKPEWIRLPPPGGKCPFTGLSRSSLYELVGHIEANGFKPPVKSVTLRKRGSSRGIRLISYDSLMAYLASFK